MPNLIYGRNAVLEAARAGRVVKVYQASGLGHDPRLEELARLARVEVVPAARIDAMAPGVNHLAFHAGTREHVDAMAVSTFTP